MKKSAVQKQNVGNAGEYYLASRLSSEDFTVSITLGRAEKYDILAVNPKGKSIKISVKSRYFNDIDRFPLSYKDEKGETNNFYYAFIRLNEFKIEPDFWIIPSKRVNEIICNAEEKWLKLRNKHKRKGIRSFWLKINKTSKPLYPKNWERELKTYYKNIAQLE